MLRRLLNRAAFYIELEEKNMSNVEKLILSKPIKINGEEVKELPYNLEDFTAKDKIAAGKEYKKSGGVISVQELDADYHIFLFAKAVEKADRNIDINDILRMNARDSTKAERIVRDFFFIDSEESQENTQMNSSDEE